jgi:hypothetical protein
MEFHLRALWGEIGNDNVVNYWLDDTSGQRFNFNDLIGKKIIITDTGVRKCRVCMEEVETVYNKGTCLDCFRNSPRCDICMIKPELCHHHKGSCRDEEFAQKWCFNNQLIYFSLTSGPKVGYLSLENYPQRWIDQGATEAIVVARANSRLEAGEIETYLAEFMNDKTNWTAMLKGEIKDPADLISLKKQWSSQIESRWPGRLTEEKEIVKISYPVISYPKKVSTVVLGPRRPVEGVLVGIKGQYLIFKDTVFSLKKHEGYIVKIEVGQAEEIELVSQASLF